MSQYKDPFYQDFYNTGVSATNVQPIPAPAPQVSLVSHFNEQSLQAIRQIVREELEQALGLASNEHKSNIT